MIVCDICKSLKRPAMPTQIVIGGKVIRELFHVCEPCVSNLEEAISWVFRELSDIATGAPTRTNPPSEIGSGWTQFHLETSGILAVARMALQPERDAHDQYHDWHDRLKAAAEAAIAKATGRN